tara:strand:- start:48 stop:881 length:834 start_codon:yes stop_codon:yes gene_type:complete
MVISRFVNKYTANFKTLPIIINKIKTNKQIPIIDYANENFKDHNKNCEVICKILETYPNSTIALKFSSLGLGYLKDIDVCKQASNIVELAVNNNSTIMIDAEQDSIQHKINKLTDYFIDKYNKDKPIIYKTYQMYRTDTFEIFQKDLEYFKDMHLGIKLVRGAYYNTDKQNNVLFCKKEDTDNSFNNAVQLFNSKYNCNHHIVVASHNKKSIELLDNYKHPNISVAHLLGFSDELSSNMTKKYKVYKYLPFGNYKDTFPYLIRRLYENYPILEHLNK